MSSLPLPDYSKFRLYWPPFTRCIRCWCTNYDCRQCIEKTGEACWWVNPYLCSACVTPDDEEYGDGLDYTFEHEEEEDDEEEESSVTAHAVS